MIDHIGIQVSDAERGIAFYTRALAPLGYTLLMRFEQFAGFGVAPKPDFWIDLPPHSLVPRQGFPRVVGSAAHPGGAGASDGRPAPLRPVHVAFRASGRQMVRDFYAAAIAAGGKDNGPPGPRPQYHEHYYGAFVLDADGNNIEAVCHEPFLG